MYTVLLAIIYISFIGLGLPDSLLGSGWVVIHSELSIPVSNAGMVSVTISMGTILSSIFSSKVINRFKTGKVTAFSTLLTAVSLIGYYYAPSLIWLILFSIPLGIGAGAVDVALNNYVAIKYKAHHMSWLHCFWGIGATLSPVIMSKAIETGNWRNGYLSTGFIQLVIALILFMTLPIWKNVGSIQVADESNKSILPAQKHKGLYRSLAVFLTYCGLEAGTGLWSSSYLMEIKGLTDVNAARFVSFFYTGITAGRFLSGFIILKVKPLKMIRYGQITIIAGIMLILISSKVNVIGFGLLFIGLGCAPIYPCMLHLTPKLFGESDSQKIMGLQMASAYVGISLLPPMFGFTAPLIALPVFLLICGTVMFISAESLMKKIS